MSTLILAFVAFVWWASNRPSGSRQELEKQAAIFKAKLDSLDGELTNLRAKDSLLTGQIRAKGDSLKIALKRASNQKIRYVEIKPLISPTSHQYDSALSALYPR